MIPGVEWRPANPEDAPAIVALQDGCFEVDRTYREVESEIRERFDVPGFDADRDSLLGVTSDGEVLVSIWSHVQDTAETEWRGWADIHVHPTHRTLEVKNFALDWWEARTTERLRAKGDDLPKTLSHEVWEHQTDELEFLEGRGYRVVRYFDQLIRDLGEPIDPPVVPDGLRIVRAVDGDPGDDRLVHNEAFRDHWGSQPHSPERWATFINEFYLADASFLVYDADRPVAHVMSASYPQDYEDRGWPHAWIGAIGVVRSHRGRGLAKVLLNRAMKAFREIGMERALLDVDSDNQTGAYGLYESVGFSLDRRTKVMRKEI